MPATIIMGGQWGDEGKGKLTDALAARAQVVVRANGGSNAGHTVSTDAGVFKLQLVPSGILNPDCTCVIGAGVVLDPTGLIDEMDRLAQRGVSLDRLRVSDRAHLVLPFHPMLDRLQEAQREDDEIGTTRRGIGPAYADKAYRHGLRVTDLLDELALRRKLAVLLDEHNRILTRVYNARELEFSKVYQDLVDASRRLRPHIVPSEVLVQDALEQGEQVLVECAQGAMLDIDYGTYPYVTSSSPSAAGACQGAGIAPRQIDRIIAVFKAYSTRVGSGPFPTELTDDTGQIIRDRGHEYGTVTGRPRRTGWFDAVAARHVVRLNGVTEIALTLLDVLDVFGSVEVGVAYQLAEETIRHLPASDAQLAQVTPIWKTLPGWQEPIPAVRDMADLPAAALGYVRFLETALGAPITMVGVGPTRSQLVPIKRTAA